MSDSASHLAAHVQGLRQQVDDLHRSASLHVDKENSFSLPGFVTSQDEDQTTSKESAWMLGQGEEGQLNADADLLENYWLRVDRGSDTDNPVEGIQGRLDFRMNGTDALLWCHAKGASGTSEFVTAADFGLGSFKIVSGAETTDSPVKFFQANLSDPATYLLTLQRDATHQFQTILTDSDASLTLAAGTKIVLDTNDVGGEDCKFHEWTQDGKSLVPPLYVLSSAASDLSILPCVFQWDKTAGHLGIGTVTGDTCPTLALLDVTVVNGLTIHAGGPDGELTLHGTSGAVSLLIGADELSGMEITYGGGTQHINVVLGTNGSGIDMDFGGGLTVAIDAGDLAALGGGVHQIKFREVDVCQDGTSMKMIVLGSETYAAS